MPNVIFILLRRMRAPIIVLILVYSISILGLVIIPGVDDHGRPWHMGFFHAFYVISYTASTIGFGELPYPFTDAQRLWMTFSIYFTVIAWLYSIGRLLTLAQNPAFQRAAAHARFARAVRHMSEPFYIICGYGDTGSLLVHALANHGVRTVVLDISEKRIEALETSDLPFAVPALCADASDSSELLISGLNHPRCWGVVAVTNNDQTNLTVALTSKLTDPDLLTICRAETQDAATNMRACGADHIVNPFESFADRLALALESESLELIDNWLTSTRAELISAPLTAPRGHWIICGYGRFGREVSQKLALEGMELAIVEPDRRRSASSHTLNIVGRGSDSQTLREAGIERAVGIIAGSDSDAMNLAIIMTARQINPTLFTVGRQNQRRNDPIFEAARLNLVMQPGSMIAHRILALILTPLLPDFLALSRRQSAEWADALVARLLQVSDDHPPDTWTVTIDPAEAPAVTQALAETQKLRIRDLFADPRDRSITMPCIPLLLARGQERVLLPAAERLLEADDRLLFCGLPQAQTRMQWALRNPNVLSYVSTGVERPSGHLWQYLASKRFGWNAASENRPSSAE
jgi:Trk K+ transport system NAD-binding subunit